MRIHEVRRTILPYGWDKTAKLLSRNAKARVINRVDRVLKRLQLTPGSALELTAGKRNTLTRLRALSSCPRQPFIGLVERSLIFLLSTRDQGQIVRVRLRQELDSTPHWQPRNLKRLQKVKQEVEDTVEKD